MEHLREQIITCSDECCGISLVAERRVELEEPGNNLVAELCSICES